MKNNNNERQQSPSFQDYVESREAWRDEQLRIDGIDPKQRSVYRERTWNNLDVD